MLYESIKQCSGTTSVIKCLVFIIFVFFGRSSFLSFSSLFRAVTGPGFQDVTFSEFVRYLFGLCFHSREFALVGKDSSCKTTSGKINLTQNVCVDFENNRK